jgi:hypothetical protein
MEAGLVGGSTSRLDNDWLASVVGQTAGLWDSMQTSGSNLGCAIWDFGMLLLLCNCDAMKERVKQVS